MNKTRFTNGYRSKPNQNYRLGFYVQSNVDTQRTNLFAPGKLSSVYFNHLMKSNYFEFETDISNSLSPFSKWDFSKISFTINSNELNPLAQRISLDTLQVLHMQVLDRVHFWEKSRS